MDPAHLDLAQPVTVETPALEPVQRQLGSVGPAEGPLVIAVGGIHGNEPEGVLAIRRVLRQLAGRSHVLAGRFMGLSGNCSALAAGLRYLGRDLNRGWRRDEHTLPPLDDGVPEDEEQHELGRLLAGILKREEMPVVILDLHATSSRSPPFVVMNDTLANRHLAEFLPIPVILGLEESLEGTLLDAMAGPGVVSLGVEGGSIGEASTVDNLESILWLTLMRMGCLDQADVPDLDTHRGRLAKAAPDTPDWVEIRYRHEVTPEDRFCMRPGYQSFQAVKEGEFLAEDSHGTVCCPLDGFILLPLYQKQGDDGFFVAHAVKDRWMKLSAWLRRRRLDRCLPWLPGVRHGGTDEHTLLVSPRVARFYTKEIFHLMGYRRRRMPGSRDLVFTRRDI